MGILESLVQQVTKRLDVVERKDEVEPRFELERASAMTTEIPLRVTSEEEQIPPQFDGFTSLNADLAYHTDLSA